MMNSKKIEKLIRIVRNYPELYDWHHKDYADNTKREQIWAAIGKELNLSPNMCKSKWTVLRSGYRKALRYGQSARKKWRFADEMVFLKDCIRERSHNKPYNGCSEATVGQLICEEHIVVKDEPNDSDNYDECNDDVEKMSSCDSATNDLEGKIHVPNIISVLGNNSHSGDPLTHFFMGIAGTVKGLPPLVQAQIKAQIFQIVSAAEISYLAKHGDEGDDKHEIISTEKYV